MTRQGVLGRRAIGIATGIAVTAAFYAGDRVSTRSERDDSSQELRQSIDGGRAKNVILLLGDGMGDSEITIARNYQVGAGGRLWMDTLPMTGAYTTYALQEANPSLVDYVTDSAASGTGWATGVRPGSAILPVRQERDTPSSHRSVTLSPVHVGIPRH